MAKARRVDYNRPRTDRMSEPTPQNILTFEYTFRIRNGQTRGFSVHLKRPSMEFVGPPATSLPPWTRLQHEQCSHCPLRPEQVPTCPVAANLVDLIHTFRDCFSFEPAEVSIRTPAREYRKTLPLQYGISSLMGVVMVSSGCPILDKMRPMVYTHLPFATPEETTYRSVSMYLLAQYFRHRNGKPVDWQLRGLVRILEDVATLNRCFSRRLIGTQTLDGNLNALVNLDCFASLSAITIEEGAFEEFECLFTAYTDSAP